MFLAASLKVLYFVNQMIISIFKYWLLPLQMMPLKTSPTTNYDCKLKNICSGGSNRTKAIFYMFLLFGSKIYLTVLVPSVCCHLFYFVTSYHVISLILANGAPIMDQKTFPNFCTSWYRNDNEEI